MESSHNKGIARRKKEPKIWLFLLALREVGGKRIEVLTGALTGIVEVSKFDGIEVTDDIISNDVIKQNNVAGTDKIKNALLAYDGIGADEKLHYHVLTDVFRKYLLHRADQIRGVEILLRRCREAVLRRRCIRGKAVLRLKILIHSDSFLSLVIGRGRAIKAMAADTSREGANP